MRPHGLEDFADVPRYRVVQWATGNVGRRSLRAVIEHPALDLVGLFVYSPAKEGVDAGELCGLAPVGVPATRRIDDIVALAPDCVLYMGDRPDADTICRLLESGANVITTRSEFHRPSGLDPALRDRLEQACRRGGSSLHSTGSSPGFITEVLPIALLSLERRLDCLTIDEYADMSSRPSPELVFSLMGFGRQLDSFDPRARAAHAGSAFGPSLGVVADAIGTPIDEIRTAGSAAAAIEDLEVAAGTVAAGTVAAQRMEVRGLSGGRPVLIFRSNWYLTDCLDPRWDLGPTGWRVQVEGDLPLDVRLSFPVPPELWGEVSPGVTAHRPVNAIPYVCAAPPGIRTAIELPQVVPLLGPGPDRPSAPSTGASLS